MKTRMLVWVLLSMIFASCLVLLAQVKPSTQEPSGQAAASAATDTDKMNIEAYIQLLREDVWEEKAQLMGAVLQLDAAEAAKFWPIFDEYNAELFKLHESDACQRKILCRRVLTDNRR